MKNIIILENTIKGYEFLGDPMFWKIGEKSLFERVIENFPKKNIIYVGSNQEILKKYDKVLFVPNYLSNITSRIYSLFISINKNYESTILFEKSIYLNQEILSKPFSNDCYFVDNNNHNLGVYYLHKESLEKILLNISKGEVAGDIYNLISKNINLDKFTLKNNKKIHLFNIEDYFKYNADLENISFECLNYSNTDELRTFYEKQSPFIKNLYKPHPFDISSLHDISNNLDENILLKRDNKIIGYGSLQGMQYDNLPSIGVIISEKERGNGIAHLLGSYLIQIAKKRKCKGIILNIDISNIPSIKFFLKLGFNYKFVKRARLYGMINLSNDNIEIPKHYIDKTCHKSPFNFYNNK